METEYETMSKDLQAQASACENALSVLQEDQTTTAAASDATVFLQEGSDQEGSDGAKNTKDQNTNNNYDQKVDQDERRTRTQSQTSQMQTSQMQ